jgi:two-component system, OmpR family, phosphate regulon sensor histidine kinase PhoR
MKALSACSASQNTSITGAGIKTADRVLLRPGYTVRVFPAICLNLLPLLKKVHSPLRKIGLLIIVIIVLPLLVFSVFEIGSLRQHEKVIQDIYGNQLDAILFSINQYTDDLFSVFAGKVENSMNTSTVFPERDLEAIMQKIPTITHLVMFSEDMVPIGVVPRTADDSLVKEITDSLAVNRKMVMRLSTYQRGGYRKVETLGQDRDGRQWLVFITSVRNSSIINVVEMDPENFIRQVLDPKMQEIARGKFFIAAFRDGDREPFYSTGKQLGSGNIENKKPFWLMKNYRMGIELKDKTISDLAHDRMRRNLLLIGVMDLLLIFGAGMIFRNISRQVELSQLKSDFVSNVSHEIRTPLALISMYIETLEMGRIKDPGKVKEYYSVIQHETSRLSGMVNRILSFSQIDSKKRKYFFNGEQLNNVVESAVLSFRYSLESKGFSCKTEMDPSLPEIKMDRDAAAEAMVNLIDNAMKYSDGNRHIIIRTGIEGEHVFAEVEDHGIGISLKDQRYIFDKFYRVTEKNLANRVKGSGLGLAIVKHIMDAHHGKVIVKSAPGEGSVFRLLFPINFSQA